MTTTRRTTVLFDLDGTLLDTAPDLAWALNKVRAGRGAAALDYALVRSVVSHGSYAMTRIACDEPEDSSAFEQFRLELLDVYADNLADRTRLFDGMGNVLDTLESTGITWGIVTNKPAWLTDPLLERVRLADRAAVVISGDTLAQRKPHPAQLLLAAEKTASEPVDCVYIGDAERDIIAGRAAGMRTVIALYGYLAADDRPGEWGADSLIDDPDAILACL